MSTHVYRHCNGLARVPSRATFLPAWLTDDADQVVEPTPFEPQVPVAEALVEQLDQPDPIDQDHPIQGEELEQVDQPPAVQPVHTCAICRCGSLVYRDIPIHKGSSVRRDCARCRKFLAFPLWYGSRGEP